MVELAVKAHPGLDGARQWINRSWRGVMPIGDKHLVDGLVSEQMVRGYEGDAGS